MPSMGHHPGCPVAASSSYKVSPVIPVQFLQYRCPCQEITATTNSADNQLRNQGETDTKPRFPKAGI